MLRSLLVPLDGSKFSEDILPFAGEIARATGASLHLAHVHVPYEPEHLLGNTQFQYEGVNFREYDDAYREQEEKYLTDLASRLAGDGAPSDAKVLNDGEIAEELAEYADEVHSDMIFLTTHGYSGVNRLWLGSVTDEIVRHTNVPLFVVHPHGEERPVKGRPIGHILVPLDGSELAECAIGPAADLAKAENARITLTRVVRSGESRSWPVLAELRERPVPPIDSALQYLQGVAEELSRDGLDVHVHVERGNQPAAAIVRSAEYLDADVIAMATHGYGGVKRTVLGSVADKILRSSTLPMLITRPPIAA
jgi:nucleotide-binding universal stress UspA family protein